MMMLLLLSKGRSVCTHLCISVPTNSHFDEGSRLYLSCLNLTLNLPTSLAPLHHHPILPQQPPITKPTQSSTYPIRPLPAQQHAQSPTCPHHPTTHQPHKPQNATKQAATANQPSRLHTRNSTPSSSPSTSSHAPGCARPSTYPRRRRAAPRHSSSFMQRPQGPTRLPAPSLR
ncbi:uncharacterized protein K452DRAFT_166082 [Aplosporella prunicola CBS 121167]|uniref:Uncharacterized protein n=1 Tax=Aplosporella prunicola CBS 121167 TaxID=1176127 RepID=A0A6A6AVQ2_9PEZI|nr:uncharacterized protein K452DRAFT_166082 [Aplosporella prunicola CBS 121167]KAF2135676.1 hypothetical protein K452DRAFT_166082 [Aplosporella prunicola CBS 121167]